MSDVICLDIETTGLDIEKDRIVSISIIRLYPIESGNIEVILNKIIDPRIPIPKEATAIHGISDDDVVFSKSFDCFAWQIASCLALSKTIIGFNINGFDLPMIKAELGREGYELNTDGKIIIDCMDVFKADHPRNLASAVRTYCKREMVAGAHSSLVDAKETMNVFLAQLQGRTIDDLVALTKSVDGDRKFKRNSTGEVVFAFGKHTNKTIDEVMRLEPRYINWMLGGNFSESTKQFLEAAIRSDTQSKEYCEYFDDGKLT